MERKDLINYFLKRISDNELILTQLKKRQFIISLIRLVVFFSGIILAFPAFKISVLAGFAEIVVFLVLFLLLIKKYSQQSEKIDFRKNMIAINKAEFNALNGDYSAFDGGERWRNREHEFSDDIDLFGNDSLFRYLNRTVTGYGREILARWLAEPYEYKNDIPGRQEAVKELSSDTDWRQEFMAYGLGRPLEKDEAEGLNNWLSDDNSDLSGITKITAVVSPVITIMLLILAILKILPFSFFTLFFILNLALTAVFIKKTNRIHSLVSKKYDFLSSFEKLITHTGSKKFNARVLKDASERLYSSGESAATKLKELSRIIQAFDSRLNFIAGVLLNGILLWDFRCIAMLERWKHSAAGSLPVWLETIGIIDSLQSLANHSANNPSFTFPEISAGKPFLEATGLGHPLIRPEVRICNDFVLDDKGHICIVTGANMSGKSTFLRTIAVNLILAMAGTTVCAGRFVFRPARLFSSMRTTDSLSDNESYFYAELRRLKILKEKLDSGEELIFILDEILKGTNSEDKSTGSKLFLAKLADRNGIGIIATHDISLGTLEKDFPGRIFNRCFEVEINGDSLIFDYKLRDGITQHMNAEILMRQMGII